MKPKLCAICDKPITDKYSQVGSSFPHIFFHLTCRTKHQGKNLYADLLAKSIAAAKEAGR